MYATTRYIVVRLKATHKFSTLEELVGGDLPPNSSQRLTGILGIAMVSTYCLCSLSWYQNLKTTHARFCNMLMLPVTHETLYFRSKIKIKM